MKKAREWLIDFTNTNEITVTNNIDHWEMQHSNKVLSEPLVTDEEIEEAMKKYSRNYLCPPVNEQYCLHDITSAFNASAKFILDKMKEREK